jgi:hypothetical protein
VDIAQASGDAEGVSFACWKEHVMSKMPLQFVLLAGSVLACTGCGYNPYPTPKPVVTPGIDPPIVVQRAMYETSVKGEQPVSVVGPTTALMPVERPLAPILKPYEQWTEQEAAADALGRIGAPAIPYLQQALRSGDPAAKKQAAEVLARMGSDARPAVDDLVALLDDPDPEVRKVAVRTLGRIGPEAAAAVPALMQSLIHQQPAPPPASGQELLPSAPPPRLLPQN